MALKYIKVDEVKPGDLITSELMKQILGEFVAFDERVTILETTVPSDKDVVIEKLTPDGPYRIGQELHIEGQNFEFSIGSCTVSIDNVVVTTFKSGTNDEELFFDIPHISNVPLNGKSAVLKISNSQSTDQKIITVLPAQPLQGAIDVIWLNVNPTTITPNNPLTFRFRLKSRTNLDATYTINPIISDVANSNTWQNNLEILDSSQEIIVTKTISLGAGQEKIFHVRINPVPNVSTGSNFTFSVNASAESVTGTTGPIYLTVGDTIDSPDNGVSLNFEAVQFEPIGDGSILHGETEDTIKLKSTGVAKITLLAEFTETGTYDVSVHILSNTANWVAQLFAQSTPSSYTITDSNLANPQQKKDETPEFIIQPSNNASTTGEVEFRIRRTSLNKRRVLRMKLELIS